MIINTDRVNHYIEETHGKSNKTFKHEDGQQHDNKVYKELLKFLAAYEAVEAFPQEFKDIKVDLELSIADGVDKSGKFTTWMKNANSNAIAKGHAVVYREKILPPLSLVKGMISTNTTAVAVISEEAKKMFMDSWENTTVDIESDNARRLKIEEVVKPLVGGPDKSQVVIDLPAVKTILGNTAVCWGCLSELCLIRQRLSFKLTGRKMVNKFCLTRRTVLGDKNLLLSLHTPCSKDKQAVAQAKKDGKKKKKSIILPL